MPLIEAAAESIADILAAQEAGADRVELCANLAEGGTTPSAGLIRVGIARARIPVFVLIRPRRGDFLYAADEIEVMLRDIERAKAEGADGIVSGALHTNGAIDEDGTDALLQATAPLPFTFHRAFDMTRDLNESLDVLMSLGADRVLSSGGQATAAEGGEVLKHLVARARNRLVVLAGGGIRKEHAADLMRATGARELHLGPRRPRNSEMRFQATAPRITRDAGADQYSSSEIDAAEVMAVVASLRGHRDLLPPRA